MKKAAERQGNFATIGEVFEDGVSLIFPGQEIATEKHYKVNTSVVFNPGDRVKILSDSGTYVVEYVVGAPTLAREESANLPSGGLEGEALIKNSADDSDVTWGLPNGTIPTGGTNDQFLKKSSNNDFDVEWAVPASQLPTGGLTGQFLAKTSNANYAVGWGNPTGMLPSGGSAGQVLKKSSATNYAVGWEDLNVEVANSVTNQYRTNDMYSIQFKTDSSGNFFIRMGSSGTWKQISVS